MRRPKLLKLDEKFSSRLFVVFSGNRPIAQQVQSPADYTHLTLDDLVIRYIHQGSAKELVAEDGGRFPPTTIFLYQLLNRISLPNLSVLYRDNFHISNRRG